VTAFSLNSPTESAPGQEPSTSRDDRKAKSTNAHTRYGFSDFVLFHRYWACDFRLQREIDGELRLVGSDHKCKVPATPRFDPETGEPVMWTWTTKAGRVYELEPCPACWSREAARRRRAEKRARRSARSR
jgi:hypothetical protein